MDDLTFEQAMGDHTEMMGEWLFETAPEIFSYIFGSFDEAVRQSATHWALPRGIFSHCHAVLAKKGDTIVGLELGFTRAEKEQHMPDMGAQFRADLDDAAFDTQIARAREVGPLLPEVPEDSYYLQNLFVRADARGPGCGKALLHRAFAEAQANRLTAVHLDVTTNNPAQGFYIANGMEATLEIRIPKLVRSHDMPGTIRMVKQL